MEDEAKKMCPVCMKCELNDQGVCEGCNMTPCEADKCTCPAETMTETPASM